MKLLVVNWEDTGVFKVVDEKAAGKDQDLLRSVSDNLCDLIKVETVRSDYQFRKAILDEQEDEETGETVYSIDDWELL